MSKGPPDRIPILKAAYAETANTATSWHIGVLRGLLRSLELLEEYNSPKASRELRYYKECEKELQRMTRLARAKCKEIKRLEELLTGVS